MGWAVVDSCARVMVRMSPVTTVTRTISALAHVGDTPGGHTVAENGVAGKLAPSPEWTVSDVPEVAGERGMATVVRVKLATASIGSPSWRYRIDRRAMDRDV